MSRLAYWVADWNLSRQQAASRLGGTVDDMVDLIGGNAARDLPNLQRTTIRKVGVYVTGTPDIVWPAAKIREYMLDGFSVVTIDQRNGPAVVADVADVESGAKTVPQAILEAEDMISRGEDYAIYVDQASLSAVQAAWARTGHEPGRIVAYQWASPTSNPTYQLEPGFTLRDANVDLSVTLPDWHPIPRHRKPQPPADVKKRAVVTYDERVDGWAVTPGVTHVNKQGDHATVTWSKADGPGWSIKPGVG